MDILRDLLLQQKKKYIRLSEVMDITMQMAEAIDRDDNVTMSMLIAMRQDPLLLIDEIEQSVGQYLDSIPIETAEHLRKILSGRGTETVTSEETMLDEQCKMNFRLLSRIVMIDKQLNRKVAKDQSFYQ